MDGDDDPSKEPGDDTKTDSDKKLVEDIQIEYIFTIQRLLLRIPHRCFFRKEKAKKPELIGFFEYYKFANRFDLLLIAWASFNSIVKGLQWPLVMIIFGEMIDDLVGVNDMIPGDKMEMFAWFYVGCGVRKCKLTPIS